MAMKEQKKEAIRQQIVRAAEIYSRELAGKTFLYVYGQEYFEVNFMSDRFLHLTGVESNLSAKDFYKKAKSKKLDEKQFYFTQNHSHGTAKKKLPCLERLPELTTTMVCILKELSTVTIKYTLGVTNLEFTLGLTEHIDQNGDKIDDVFLPRTLRVKDDTVAKSADGDIVDFIFMKDASKSTYETLAFEDKGKKVPESVRKLIDPKFYQNESDDESMEEV